MPYNRDEFAFEATALKGAAALTEALATIGYDVGEGKDGDKEVARIVTENEMPLRALLTFALTELSNRV